MVICTSRRKTEAPESGNEKKNRKVQKKFLTRAGSCDKIIKLQLTR